jgi:hypothetical protein
MSIYKKIWYNIIMKNKKLTPIEKKMLLNRRILKLILNFWTILTITLFTVDFFSGNRFDSSAGVVGIIYMAILGIYAGEKEYVRWKTKFVSYFIGEAFVILWTIIMAIFVVLAPLSAGAYKLPAEFAIVYTSTIGIFAITRHSKSLKNE